MKKILLLLMMGFSLLTFSQEIIFSTKYMQICEFDYDEDDYIINDEAWINTELETSEEYAILKLAEEVETKIWWEFNEEESNDDYNVYYTENNIDKFVFDYIEEEIYMFSEYNNSTNQYDELLILSKITVE